MFHLQRKPCCWQLLSQTFPHANHQIATAFGSRKWEILLNLEVGQLDSNLVFTTSCPYDLEKKAIQTGAHLNFLLCRAVIRPSSSCRTDLAGWGGMAEGEGNNRADNLLCTEPLMSCFIFTSVPQRWVSLLLAPFKRKLGSKSKVTFPKSSLGTQPLLLEPWSSQN